MKENNFAYNEKCSILLKRTNTPITYLTDVRGKIEYSKRKNPRCGRNRIGVFFVCINYNISKYIILVKRPR